MASHGIEPGDIRSIDDLSKLPTFNSDDIKNSQTEDTPFGAIAGIDRSTELRRQPLKLQTSGGTTGKARPTLYGVVEWEMNGLQIARSHYLQGAGPATSSRSRRRARSPISHGRIITPRTTTSRPCHSRRAAASLHQAASRWRSPSTMARRYLCRFRVSHYAGRRNPQGAGPRPARAEPQVHHNLSRPRPRSSLRRELESSVRLPGFRQLRDPRDLPCRLRSRRQERHVPHGGLHPHRSTDTETGAPVSAAKPATWSRHRSIGVSCL